jgi:hypothetical protein
MIKKHYPFIIILSIWFFFSSPFVMGGKNPFPSDYQTNFFQPWSVYPGMKGPVKNNAQPDIITQIYPWRYFSIEELKNGRLPFWNPYNFAGTPHLANYQSAVLSPFNILFFLPLSFIDAWGLLVLLQPLLAGFSTYLFVRKLGISKEGSLISSVSFMFCGFLTTWMGYATLGYAILPLPLALYSILKFKEERKVLWLILLSLSFPFSFFAGHFQTSMYFALGVFLYIFYSIKIEKDIKVYIKSLVFALSGILLVMPQVLHSVEIYLNAARRDLFQKI